MDVPVLSSDPALLVTNSTWELFFTCVWSRLGRAKNRNSICNVLVIYMCGMYMWGDMVANNPTSGVYIIAPISINPHPTFCKHLYFEDFVLEIESEDVKWYAVGRFGGQRAPSVRLASHPCFHTRQRATRGEGTFKGENYFITRKAQCSNMSQLFAIWRCVLRRESYLRDVFF